ncbi:hypothetical protein HHK36_006331 [Tetracentron sinense]|uniref:F-box/LRR-repeat protein 15-like leucin rich repeat domain-containing protein n=1 Tax=Tetracentron sinense TaxID=13715 RepID=A0A834ZH26_TETSI|nr:hypothetical protein HHK36_006331 [Tetracentron sinense]
MAKRWEDLPEECWELVFDRIEDQRHFEALSLVCKRFLSISNLLRSSLTVSNPTILVHHTVSGLLRRFLHLKRIDLAEFHGDLDRLVREIAYSGLNLEALNLSNQIKLPVESMKEMGTKMKSLRILICSRLCLLQDSDLIAISDSFPSLEEFDISYPEQDYGSPPESYSIDGFMNSAPFPGIVTDVGIAVLSSKLRDLCKVNLSGNHFISDRSLVALSSNCLSLREIAVRDCSFISQNGIGSVIRHSPNLISLSVHGIRVSSSLTIQNSFLYAKALRILDFSQMVILDDFLYSIGEANLPLQRVVLSRCRGFTITGISSLLYVYRSLDCLDLAGADFLTDQNITDLSNYLHNLTSISLNSCSSLTNSTFLTLTKNCPSLEEIRMEQTSLGKEGFPAISEKNPRIRSLKLAWSKCLSNETLKKIGFICPKLRILDVSHCWSITEEGIEEIGKNCFEIRELEVNGCGRVRNLGKSLEFSKLEVLHAAGSGFNDEGLSMVGQSCRGLLHLNLEGCLGVTTRGVKEVVGSCKVLREMSLKNCSNVSIDVLVWMVFTRPSLRKIISPAGFVPTEKQRDLLLRHGCLVCKG